MLRAYIALFQIDMKLAFRARSVLFFNYFFPLLFFFIFGQLYNADQGNVIFQVVSMVTALGILGNGLDVYKRQPLYKPERCGCRDTPARPRQCRSADTS